MDADYLTFVGVATLLTLTPGADMALVTGIVLRAGAKAGLRAVAGTNLGVLAWAGASAVGRVTGTVLIALGVRLAFQQRQPRGLVRNSWVRRGRGTVHCARRLGRAAEGTRLESV